MANPISHAIGMLGALLIPVDRGKAVHLLDLWDPGVVLDLMVSEDLGAGGGAPYFLTSLLDHPQCGEIHLERLHFQGMGGAPVPQAVMERGTDLGLSIYSMYGSTEHPSITGCTYEDPAGEAFGHGWTAAPGLRDQADRSRWRGGRDGGTRRNPFARARMFFGVHRPVTDRQGVRPRGLVPHGRHRILDHDGYLAITDRISDVIIRGGENISAAEVEEVLMTLPGVAEVAVVAAPDDRMGEHAAAFFRMVGGSAAPALSEIAGPLDADGVARQKWPEELHSVVDFPRTSSGKIQKYVLRERLRHPGN